MCAFFGGEEEKHEPSCPLGGHGVFILWDGQSFSDSDQFLGTEAFDNSQQIW